MDLHTSLTTFDYIVLGCVLLSGLLALVRGLVREVCSLAAWIGAFAAAAKLSFLAEPLAHQYVKSEALASNAAMLITFCGAFVVLSLIGMLISKLVHGDTLTAIDRSLGFVFGLLRGALLVCLIYLVAISTLWPHLDTPSERGAGTIAKADSGRAIAGEDLAAPPPIAKNVLSAETSGSAALSSDGRDKTRASQQGSAISSMMSLEHSKTRPFLAYGAHWLRSLLPANTEELARERRGALEKQIERGAQELLVTPPAGQPASNGRTQSYDHTSRSGMDALINKKSEETP